MNAKRGPSRAALEIAAKQSEEGRYHQRPAHPAIEDARARIEAAASTLAAGLMSSSGVALDAAAEGALLLIDRALADLRRAAA